PDQVRRSAIALSARRLPYDPQATGELNQGGRRPLARGCHPVARASCARPWGTRRDPEAPDAVGGPSANYAALARRLAPTRGTALRGGLVGLTGRLAPTLGTALRGGLVGLTGRLAPTLGTVCWLGCAIRSLGRAVLAREGSVRIPKRRMRLAALRITHIHSGQWSTSSVPACICAPIAAHA